MPAIIGLGHKKNMGKDETAKSLVIGMWEAWGIDARVASLSDSLFDMGHTAFEWAGMESAAYYSTYYEEKDKDLPGLPGVTPRDVAKHFGDAVRKCHPDALVQAVIHSGKHSVITNIRFPNEARCVKEAGGHLIKIVRPGIDTDPDDPFDTALDDFDGWDGTIVNDGTLHDLRRKAFKYVSDHPEQFTPMPGVIGQ